MVTLYTFAPIVTGIGECVRAELATTTAGAPARACLMVPGQIAWDSCGPDDCGQLTLSITRIFYSQTFPAESVIDWSEAGCPPTLLAADVTVSILRCAPGPDDAGNPPTCDELLAAALVWDADARAVRKAVGCCLADLVEQDQISAYTIRSQTPAGPEGGCVGSELSLTMAVPHCACPAV